MGDVGDFLVRLAPEWAEATVVYDGERPDHLSVTLARRYVAAAYVYMFLRDNWAIYVGMSVSPVDRFAAHKQRDWFLVSNQYVLVRYGVPHPEVSLRVGRDGREAALSVERQAIRMFGPSHNVAGVLR